MQSYSRRSFAPLSSWPRGCCGPICAPGSSDLSTDSRPMCEATIRRRAPRPNLGRGGPRERTGTSSRTRQHGRYPAGLLCHRSSHGCGYAAARARACGRHSVRDPCHCDRRIRQAIVGSNVRAAWSGCCRPEDALHQQPALLRVLPSRHGN